MGLLAQLFSEQSRAVASGQQIVSNAAQNYASDKKSVEDRAFQKAVNDMATVMNEGMFAPTEILIQYSAKAKELYNNGFRLTDGTLLTGEKAIDAYKNNIGKYSPLELLGMGAGFIRENYGNKGYSWWEKNQIPNPDPSGAGSNPISGKLFDPFEKGLSIWTEAKKYAHSKMDNSKLNDPASQIKETLSKESFFTKDITAGTKEQENTWDAIIYAATDPRVIENDKDAGIFKEHSSEPQQRYRAAYYSAIEKKLPEEQAAIYANNPIKYLEALNKADNPLAPLAYELADATASSYAYEKKRMSQAAQIESYPVGKKGWFESPEEVRKKAQTEIFKITGQPDINATRIQLKAMIDQGQNMVLKKTFTEKARTVADKTGEAVDEGTRNLGQAIATGQAIKNINTSPKGKENYIYMTNPDGEIFTISDTAIRDLRPEELESKIISNDRLKTLAAVHNSESSIKGIAINKVNKGILGRSNVVSESGNNPGNYNNINNNGVNSYLDVPNQSFSINDFTK